MDSIQWVLVKMILAMGILGGIFFLLVRVLKQSGLVKKHFSSDFKIRLLCTEPIAPKKYISLVEIGEEVFAIGVSEAQVTLLTKIENKASLKRTTEDPMPEAEPLKRFHSFFEKKQKAKDRII